MDGKFNLEAEVEVLGAVSLEGRKKYRRGYRRCS
jgi:hypothetical protein